MKCSRCNDTGMIACRSRDGQYAFAGPVPDDAKGYFDADCWYCEAATIERLRGALERIAGKNDLEGVSDELLFSAMAAALHDCEIIARNALDPPSANLEK